MNIFGAVDIIFDRSAFETLIYLCDNVSTLSVIYPILFEMGKQTGKDNHRALVILILLLIH